MIDGLLLAFQFLTRIPIKKNIEFSEYNLTRSIFFYPLVGGVIGLLSSFVYYLFSLLSLNIGAFMGLISMIVLTGGLHIDGLADTFDGFFSYRDKDKTLEILKDSRIGAFGVIGIVLILLFKYILIKDISNNVFIILPLAMSNSRLVAAYAISFKRVAKKEGLGNLFSNSSSSRYFIASLLLYLGILLYIEVRYIIPLLLNFLFSSYITHKTYRKIGGYTGDVYGMLIEIGEVLSMVGFVGVFKWIL